MYNGNWGRILNREPLRSPSPEVFYHPCPRVKSFSISHLDFLNLFHNPLELGCYMLVPGEDVYKSFDYYWVNQEHLYA